MNYESRIMNNYFKIIFGIFAFFILYSLFLIPEAKAATLYLEPAEGEYYQDDTFIVEVRIDSEGEQINTVKVNLNFPQDKLKIVDAGKGGSILTLWAEEPVYSNENGTLSFIGGIPQGFRGEGKLLSVPFRVRQTDAKIEFLDTSVVLLNDGLGTPAKLTFPGAIFTILPEIAEVPRDEWQEELEKDKTPPEPFEIFIGQDPAIFDGKYFIAFFTTDVGTGVDYYEVLEADERGYQRGTTLKAEWKRAESPYLLEDQSLQSIIKVRAVDKAGNERVAEIIPPYKITWKEILLGIIIVAMIGVVIWQLIRRFRK